MSPQGGRIDDLVLREVRAAYATLAPSGGPVDVDALRGQINRGSPRLSRSGSDTLAAIDELVRRGEIKVGQPAPALADDQRAANLDRARTAKAEKRVEELSDSIDPRDNAAKIKALVDGRMDSITLYRQSEAGPSGQRRNNPVGRIRHTPDNPSGEFQVRDPSSGDLVGWINHTPFDGQMMWRVTRERGDGGFEFQGYAETMALGADVLTFGLHGATGRHDSRRISPGRFVTPDEALKIRERETRAERERVAGMAAERMRGAVDTRTVEDLPNYTIDRLLDSQSVDPEVASMRRRAMAERIRRDSGTPFREGERVMHSTRGEVTYNFPDEAKRDGTFSWVEFDDGNGGIVMTDSLSPLPPAVPDRTPSDGNTEALRADIRSAVQKLQERQGGWVNLADLRDELGSRYGREQVNDALRALAREPDVRMVPAANKKGLDERDHGAALRLSPESEGLSLAEMNKVGFPEPLHAIAIEPKLLAEGPGTPSRNWAGVVRRYGIMTRPEFDKLAEGDRKVIVDDLTSAAAEGEPDVADQARRTLAELTGSMDSTAAALDDEPVDTPSDREIFAWLPRYREAVDAAFVKEFGRDAAAIDRHDPTIFAGLEGGIRVAFDSKTPVDVLVANVRKAIDDDAKAAARGHLVGKPVTDADMYAGDVVESLKGSRRTVTHIDDAGRARFAEGGRTIEGVRYTLLSIEERQVLPPAPTPARELDTPRVKLDDKPMTTTVPKAATPNEPTLGVRTTSAGRETTVTLPDGTVAKRTSKTREYTHAVVATTDLHASARRRQVANDRRRAFVEAFEAWRARGSDFAELKAYPSANLSYADQQRGMSKTEYFLPGFEPTRVTPRGGRAYWEDGEQFSLPDPNDRVQLQQWSGAVGTLKMVDSGKTRFDEFDPDQFIARHRDTIDREQAGIEKLAAGPQYEYSVYRWSQSADNAFKAIGEFAGGTRRGSADETRYEVITVGGTAVHKDVKVKTGPTEEEKAAAKLTKAETDKAERTKRDAEWVERKVADIRRALDEGNEGFALSHVISTNDRGLRMIARAFGIKSTPRGMGDRAKTEWLRNAIMEAAKAPAELNDRQRKVVDKGTRFTGNPYFIVRDLEALTDADFASLTSDQQDNVRFVLRKLAQRQGEGDTTRAVQRLQQRFGTYTP